MNNSVNIQELKQKLSNKVLESDWDIIDNFIHNEFGKILYNLINQVDKDHRFVPKVKDIFNAFVECPHDDLKVVMIAQDPYNNVNVPDGIAFSCSNIEEEEPMLKYIFDELEKTIDPEYNRDLDLSRWSKLGVLLLNTALTTNISKPGSHYSLWKPFTIKILEYLNHNFSDLIIVLFGYKAVEWLPYLNKHHIIKTLHPLSAEYANTNWDSKDLFNTINKKLKELNKSSIKW